VTTGSSPQRISDPVEPLWTGDASDYYAGGLIAGVGSAALTELDGVLYMAFSIPGDSRRVLVHDTEAGWFSLYDFPARYIHAFDGSVWFGDTALYEHKRSYTADDGAKIPARWRSGWLDFGNPDVKSLRASKAWGRDSVALSVASDFDRNTGVPVQLAFGLSSDAPQWNTSTWGGTTWASEALLTPRQRRRAQRGTTFSFTAAGEAPWALHRITHQVRQVRQPGIEDTTKDTE
jgi:hypothetical protein